MKTRIILLSILSSMLLNSGFAQEIEYDDMYFNAKDRAKLTALKGNEISYSATGKNKTADRFKEDEPSNPTDSYSSRNVNPEYTSRENSSTSQADNEDYYVNDYKYNNQNRLNNWNNNFNDWYGNPWYGSNYWGPSINSWNSPYYGSYYDNWGNPWNNPYYRSGWSSSFSYHSGSSWNYGWGGGIGMNYGCRNSWSSWGSPYYGWDPYSNFYGGGWGGYPTRVIVVDNNSRYTPAYGKRNSRSSQIIRDGNDNNNGSSRNPNPGYTNQNFERRNSGGRVSDNSTDNSSRQSEYYNRSWREDNRRSTSTENNNSNSGSSSWNNSNGSSNNSRSWGDSNMNRSSNSTNSTPSYSPPSRSSSDGSGSRSSSGSSSGSSNSNSGSRSSSRGRGGN
jgi:hypothetical protein